MSLVPIVPAKPPKTSSAAWLRTIVPVPVPMPTVGLGNSGARRRASSVSVLPGPAAIDPAAPPSVN